MDHSNYEHLMLVVALTALALAGLAVNPALGLALGAAGIGLLVGSAM